MFLGGSCDLRGAYGATNEGSRGRQPAAHHREANTVIIVCACSQRRIGRSWWTLRRCSLRRISDRSLRRELVRERSLQRITVDEHVAACGDCGTDS